ncbi:unnamed protein product [Paramecium octaurelia]|uniref:Uncharacterized protein n=1 Tax=Paramecium octaurelia TaxID=43137 RepID=A0A8S1S4C1_PAROT|nr:unnamed protein product [Paramecium octaurelia]
MEISNRQDIDKLIAYSKSIQVGLIEDDFYDQYTPPEKHVYELETLPDIKLEEFEPNLNEDEMLKLLKQNVQSAKIKESVSSEHDSLDSSDSIERRSTPPKCKQQQQVDPQIQIHVQKSQTTVDMTEYNKVPEEVLQLLEGAKERKSMLGAAIKILKEPVCYCNPKENLLRSTFLTLNNTFKSMLPKVLQSYKLFEQAQLIIIIIIITSRDCLDTLTMLMHMKLDLLTMTLNSKQKWLLVPLTKKKKSFQLKPMFLPY